MSFAPHVSGVGDLAQVDAPLIRTASPIAGVAGADPSGMEVRRCYCPRLAEFDTRIVAERQRPGAAAHDVDLVPAIKVWPVGASPGSSIDPRE